MGFRRVLRFCGVGGSGHVGQHSIYNSGTALSGPQTKTVTDPSVAQLLPSSALELAVLGLRFSIQKTQERKSY